MRSAGLCFVFSGTETNFKATDLSPATSYATRVCAINAIGVGAFSDIAVFSTKPRELVVDLSHNLGRCSITTYEWDHPRGYEFTSTLTATLRAVLLPSITAPTELFVGPKGSVQSVAFTVSSATDHDGWFALTLASPFMLPVAQVMGVVVNTGGTFSYTDDGTTRNCGPLINVTSRSSVELTTNSCRIDLKLVLQTD
jgi:hypothetical protein